MEPDAFTLSGRWPGWLGGEPRVFSVVEEDDISARLPGIAKARVIDVTYSGGGLSQLLDDIAIAADVATGGLQAMLENLEQISLSQPLVVAVRSVHKLLSDVGPAVLHLACDWENFTHHGSSVSQMYLVLETGPRALVDKAFHPGGNVHWLSER